MNLVTKTGDGRTLVPTLTVSYACKSCGYVNDIVYISGGKFMAVPNGAKYESLCHDCDDVEVLTWELFT